MIDLPILDVIDAMTTAIAWGLKQVVLIVAYLLADPGTGLMLPTEL